MTKGIFKKRDIQEKSMFKKIDIQEQTYVKLADRREGTTDYSQLFYTSHNRYVNV